MKAIVYSESIKFFSSKWCLGGAAIAIVLPFIVVIFTSSYVIPDALYLAMIGVVLYSAAFFGQDFEDALLRTTLLAIPHRGKLFIGKGLLLGVISLISISVLIMAFAIQGNLNTLSNIPLVVVSWIQMSWFTGFVAVIAKSHIVPVAIYLPLILHMNNALMFVTPYSRFLPDLAIRNVFMTYEIDVFLSMSMGVLVQFIWVAVAGITAIALLFKRDVR